jgi:hypothetical protein
MVLMDELESQLSRYWITASAVLEPEGDQGRGPEIHPLLQELILVRGGFLRLSVRSARMIAPIPNRSLAGPPALPADDDG